MRAAGDKAYMQLTAGQISVQRVKHILLVPLAVNGEGDVCGAAELPAAGIFEIDIAVIAGF